MVPGALQGPKTKVFLPCDDWLHYFRPCCVHGISLSPLVSHSHWVFCDIPVEYAFWFYVCKAWEGVGVVASARKLIGATDPLQAEPGTIRGDLAVQRGR
jgi:hypothetical protein